MRQWQKKQALRARNKPHCPALVWTSHPQRHPKPRPIHTRPVTHFQSGSQGFEYSSAAGMRVELQPSCAMYCSSSGVPGGGLITLSAISQAPAWRNSVVRDKSGEADQAEPPSAHTSGMEHQKHHEHHEGMAALPALQARPPPRTHSQVTARTWCKQAGCLGPLQVRQVAGLAVVLCVRV